MTHQFKLGDRAMLLPTILLTNMAYQIGKIDYVAQGRLKGCSMIVFAEGRGACVTGNQNLMPLKAHHTGLKEELDAE
jgi:hypothetical protein